jgi:hypothetical protein
MSSIEELTLDLKVDGMPSDRENELEGILWPELLLTDTHWREKAAHRLFTVLTLQLSQALLSDAGELLLELLLK